MDTGYDALFSSMHVLMMVEKLAGRMEILGGFHVS